ncbi:hypothetical protein Tco_1028665 [Tanacetum coccineum]|uniref:Uncharacterized protein n=1 Tax=Tanacetum coccineum TaxID=301880 RepID=A0ABQ5G2T2_9ASTR
MASKDFLISTTTTSDLLSKKDVVIILNSSKRCQRLCSKDTSGPRSTTTKGVQIYNPVPSTRTTNVISLARFKQFHLQQELDHLRSLYDELFNDGLLGVTSLRFSTDILLQQDTLPSTNIHPTSEPTTPTNVHAEENNDNQA